MEWNEVVEFLKTVAGHAGAGFIAGFMGAQVVPTPDNWQFALQTAAFWGAIGAVREVMAYIDSVLPRKAATGHRVGGKRSDGKLGKYFA